MYVSPPTYKTLLHAWWSDNYGLGNGDAALQGHDPAGGTGMTPQVRMIMISDGSHRVYNGRNGRALCLQPWCELLTASATVTGGDRRVPERVAGTGPGAVRLGDRDGDGV